jgi:hypothetical protein
MPPLSLLCLKGGFGGWNVCFWKDGRIEGVYDPTLRFEMQMVKVVYRRHVTCDAVSHAKGTLDEAGEVDMLVRRVCVLLRVQPSCRDMELESSRARRQGQAEAALLKQLENISPQAISHWQYGCICILGDATYTTSSRMQEKERKG